MSRITSKKQADQNLPNPFFGWEELYGRPLKDIERQEISHNLGEFFAILNEWREEEARASLNEKQGEATDAQEKSPDEEIDEA